jgi:hypothetical protein
VAINGDWWSNDGEQHLPDTYPRGLAVGDGKHFSGTVDRTSYGVVAFGPSIAMHSVMEEDLGGPHFWMQDVVSGQPTLVWDGQLRDNPASHCGVKRARTAVGFDATRTKMFLAVVQEVSGSVGMTCNQMAALMRSLGCHSALNQDGGGSSTMWTKPGGVLNAPTDGKQRSLVNHWGVIASGDGPPRSCVARDVATPAQGVRRHVKDPAAMTAWRFRQEDVNLMGKDVFVEYPEGAPIEGTPRLLQHSDSSLWLVDQGTRRRFLTFYAIATWRVQMPTVEKNADAELATLPEGPAVRELPHLVYDEALAVWLIDTAPGVPPSGGEDAGGAGPGGLDGGEPANGARPGRGLTPQDGDGDGTEGGCRQAPGGDVAWPVSIALGAVVLAAVRRKRGGR